MEKLASGTAFLSNDAVNFADLNRGQFVRGERIELRWNFATQRRCICLDCFGILKKTMMRTRILVHIIHLRGERARFLTLDF